MPKFIFLVLVLHVSFFSRGESTTDYILRVSRQAALFEQIERLNEAISNPPSQPSSSEGVQCPLASISDRDTKRIGNAVVDAFKNGCIDALYYYRYELSGAAALTGVTVFLKYLSRLGIDTNLKMSNG